MTNKYLEKVALSEDEKSKASAQFKSNLAKRENSHYNTLVGKQSVKGALGGAVAGALTSGAIGKFSGKSPMLKTLTAGGALLGGVAGAKKAVNNPNTRKTAVVKTIADISKGKI